ncbi:hypothetical protein [Gallaecimonas pentaromativorans]|uniref:hypothetical protein n=1 Tax=Gallaecimonas pentaromativorans TaxID=584787 RepID=UPI003A9411A8
MPYPKDRGETDKKHDLVFNYSKIAYEDYQQTLNDIESKAAKFISLLSTGIVAFTVLIRIFQEKIFSMGSFGSVFSFVLVLSTYFFFSVAWYRLYKTLSISIHPIRKFDRNFMNVLLSRNLNKARRGLAIHHRDAIKVMCDVIHVKSANLQIAYDFLCYSMVSFTISFVCSGFLMKGD